MRSIQGSEGIYSSSFQVRNISGLSYQKANNLLTSRTRKWRSRKEETNVYLPFCSYFLPMYCYKIRMSKVFTVKFVESTGLLCCCFRLRETEKAGRDNVGNWPNIVLKRNCRGCYLALTFRIKKTYEFLM